MADPQPNSDKLSGEDLSALVETMQHLRGIQDPRADKVGKFIAAQVKSGNVEPLDTKNPDHAIAYGFTAGNMLHNAWEGAKSVVKGTADVAKDLVQNPNWVQGQDSTLNKFVIQPSDAEFQKVQPALKEGRYSEAAGHALAAAVPMVGPAAAQIGEQAGSGDVGGALAKGAAQAVTPMAISKGAGLLARQTVPAARALSEKMYQSALKPSTTYSPAEVKSMVQTGLKNEIPVSEAGAAKLGDLIDDLNAKIKATVQSRPGAVVDARAIASRLADTAKRFSTQVNPTADLKAISESGNEFLSTQPGQIPAADAQALKQGTYTQLKGKAYGEMQTATKEAQKALARGIKEELNTQFPELKDLNAQDSKLYGLDEALERAVNRISNRNMVSLGGKVVAGTLAGAATGHLMGGAGVGLVLHEVITNPALQTKLAIAMSKASKGAVTLPSARARIASYSAGLAAANASSGDNPANPTN